MVDALAAPDARKNSRDPGFTPMSRRFEEPAGSVTVGGRAPFVTRTTNARRPPFSKY